MKKAINRTVPILHIRLFSIIATLVIIVILIFISINVTGFIYELKHPIPKGEKDLGFGLVMLFWLFILLVCAILSLYPIYKYILKRISKLLGGDNS